MISKNRKAPKRVRVFFSCTECRRRKIKCDRGKPICGHCMRHGLAEQCHYDSRIMCDSIESSDLPRDIIIKKLRELESLLSLKKQASQIKRYGINSDDCINFYAGYPTIMILYSKVSNLRPLSWVAMVFLDPFLRKIHNFVVGSRAHQSSIPPLQSMRTNQPELKKDKLEQKIMGRSGMNDINPIDNQHSHGYLLQKPDPDLITSIIRVLPSKKVIWLLLDRYFSFVYPFMPYLDHKYFTHRVETFIGKRALLEEHVTNVHLTKKLDIATIGILLYILKIARISLNSNYTGAPDYPHRSSAELYLIKQPLSSKLTEVGNLCLKKFTIFQKNALVVSKFLLIIAEYVNISSTTVFTNDKLQQYWNYLINSGFACGLNRDPDKYDPLSNTPTYRSLLRKIWYSYKFSSTLQSVMFGFPLLITKNMYDTKLPVFSQSASNNPDINIERETIEGMERQEELIDHLMPILYKLMDVRASHNIAELIEDLEVLENYVKDKWTSLSTLLTPTDGNHSHNIAKVKQIMAYIEALTLIHPIFYRLMLYYEEAQQPEACYHMCLKIFQFVIEIYAHSIHLFKYGYRYFGVGFDFYMTAFLETALQKCLQIQMAFYVRVSSLKARLESDPHRNQRYIDIVDHFLHDMMMFNFQRSANIMLPIAENSAIVWLLLRLSTPVYEMFTKKEFPLDKKQYNFLWYLNEEQLMKLFHAADIRRFDQKMVSSGSESENSLDQLSSQKSGQRSQLLSSLVKEKDFNVPSIEGLFPQRLDRLEDWSEINFMDQSNCDLDDSGFEYEKSKHSDDINGW